MRKLAAIPFLFLYSCIFFEAPNDVIVEATFTPIDDVSGDYTTETTLLDISDIACREKVKSITDGILTLEFNGFLFKSGSNICRDFDNWGSFPEVENSNPHQLDVLGGSSISISLSHPVRTFGFEMRPSGIGVNDIRVRFFSKTKLIGVINITAANDEFDIPKGILFSANTNEGFENVVIDGMNSETGFSLAQFRYVLK